MYYHEWSIPPPSETFSLQVVEMNQLSELCCHVLDESLKVEIKCSYFIFLSFWTACNVVMFWIIKTWRGWIWLSWSIWTSLCYFNCQEHLLTYVFSRYENLNEPEIQGFKHISITIYKEIIERWRKILVSNLIMTAWKDYVIMCSFNIKNITNIHVKTFLSFHRRTCSPTSFWLIAVQCFSLFDKWSIGLHK